MPSLCFHIIGGKVVGGKLLPQRMTCDISDGEKYVLINERKRDKSAVMEKRDVIVMIILYLKTDENGNKNILLHK